MIIPCGRRGKKVDPLQFEAHRIALILGKAPVSGFLRIPFTVAVRRILFLQDPDSIRKGCGGQIIISSHVERLLISFFHKMKPFSCLGFVIGVFPMGILTHIRQCFCCKPCKMLLGQIQIFPKPFPVGLGCQAERFQNTGLACGNRSEAPAGTPGSLRFDRCYGSPLTKVKLLRKGIRNRCPGQLRIKIIHVLSRPQQVIRRFFQLFPQIIDCFRFPAHNALGFSIRRAFDAFGFCSLPAFGKHHTA